MKNNILLFKDFGFLTVKGSLSGSTPRTTVMRDGSVSGRFNVVSSKSIFIKDYVLHALCFCFQA